MATKTSIKLLQVRGSLSEEVLDARFEVRTFSPDRLTSQKPHSFWFKKTAYSLREALDSNDFSDSAKLQLCKLPAGGVIAIKGGYRCIYARSLEPHEDSAIRSMLEEVAELEIQENEINTYLKKEKHNITYAEGLVHAKKADELATKRLVLAKRTELKQTEYELKALGVG